MAIEMKLKEYMEETIETTDDNDIIINYNVHTENEEISEEPVSIINGIGGSLNPSDTAILFIEYQNDFVHEDGALYAAVESELKRQDMLAKSKQLLDYARERDIQIIHAPITYCAEYEENANRYGVLYNVATKEAFGNENWGARFHIPMQPKADEFIVKGKHGLDTFAGTNLDDILQSLGIVNLAICGLLTNCCVESTMRTGYEYGYNIITIHDCCAATSKEEHENSVNNTFVMFSLPVTYQEFINASCVKSMDKYPILPPSSVMHSRQKFEYLKLTHDIAELMISRFVSLVVIIQLLITSTDTDGDKIDNDDIMLEIMFLYIIAVGDIFTTFLLFVTWCYCYDRSKFENADSWFPKCCRTQRVAKLRFVFKKFEQTISVVDVLKIIVCVSVGIKRFSTKQQKAMISSLIFTFITGMLELIHIIYTAVTKM